MSKCDNCGSELAEGAQFCGKCGSAQDASGADATQAMLTADGQQTQAGNTSAGKGAPAAAAPASSYKDAKAAYKQARKDAGKSNKPVIILVIMGIIVIAAAAVAATLFITGQNQSEPETQVEEVVAAEPEPEAEPATGEGDSSDSSSISDEAVLSATAGDYDGPYASYVGTWKGQMVSTEGGGYKRCYGAEGQEMVLTITSISATGHMKASIELLYHGHSAIDRSDVDSSDGDKRVTFSDLTGTFDTEGFEFSIPVGTGEDNRVEIEVEEDGSALIATVTSYYQDDRAETDTYELTKVS